LKKRQIRRRGRYSVVSVVSLAGDKTYGIQVAATMTDGRQTSTGSRSFQTPAAAKLTASPSPATYTKYYYLTLFGLLVAGFIRLCCSCRSHGGT